MRKLVTRIFQLKKGELSLVLFSFFHSFFTGISQVFTGTTANTLFLSNFNAELLPLIYITSSLIVPFIGVLIIQKGRGNSQKTIVKTVILFLSIIPGLLLLLLLYFPGLPIIIIVLMIWVDIEIVLSDLVFWQVSNKFYNIRQAKRLFGLIGSGYMTAYIVSGLLIPFIVQYVEIPLMLIVSISGQFFSLLILLKMFKRYSKKYDSIYINQESDTTTVKVILKEKYFRNIFLMVGLGYLVYYFIDLLFYKAGQTLLIPGKDTASFLGLFWSVVGIGNLVIRTVFYSRWVSATGISGGLLAGPVIIGIGVLSALIISIIYPGISLILTIIIIIKFSERVFINSLYVPSYFTLFQPLEDNIRYKLQNITETVIGQGAGSIAGVFLFLIFGFVTFSTPILFFLLLLIVAVWIKIIRNISREYRKSLAKTLTSERLKGKAVSLTNRDTDYLKARLLGDDPYTSRAALNILVYNKIYISHNEQISLLNSNSKIIRREICNYLTRNPDSRMVPHLLKNFDLKKRDVCEFTEAIGATAEDVSYNFLYQFIDNSNPALQDKVVFALLQNFPSRVDADILRTKFHNLVIAENSADRTRAAFIIPKLSDNEFYSDIELLLQDTDNDVQIRTIKSLATDTISQHIETLIDLASVSGLDSIIINTIAKAESKIIEQLENIYSQPHKDSFFRKVIILRIYGKMGNRNNQYLLCAKLYENNFVLRGELLNALQSCTYSAQEYDIAMLHRILDDERKYCTRIFSFIDLLVLESESLLKDAFSYEITKSIERIFITLSFIYSSEEILLILNNLTSVNPDKRAYAMELAETILTKRDKKNLVPVIEESISKVNNENIVRENCSVHTMEKKKLIKEIKKGVWNNPWIKNCALSLDKDQEASNIIRIVQLLKNTELFSEIPNEKLATLAPVVKELKFKNEFRIIQKDEPGSSMYILADGRVKVHDKEKELAEIGKGGFFGEFSALSPEPRSASITAITEVRLLRIEQKIFLNFLQSNPEAGRAIISVLCRRIREKNKTRKLIQPEKMPEPVIDLKNVESNFVDKYLILKSMQLFSEIPEAFIIEAAERVIIRKINKNQILYSTGERSTSLFMVIEGEFEAGDNKTAPVIISVNKMIGELSALDSIEREQTIQAVTDSRVVEINQKILFDLMWDRNELINGFLQVLISRLRRINKY